MPHAERVVFGLTTFRKTRQTAVLAHRVHLVFASGKDFVRIALVSDIPHQLVFGRVVNVVQRNRQFDRAQIAGEMPAGLPDRFQQKGAQLAGKVRQLFFVQTAQVLRAVNQVE